MQEPTEQMFSLEGESKNMGELLDRVAAAMERRCDAAATAGEGYPMPETRAEWGREIARQAAAACEPYWQRLYEDSTGYQAHLAVPRPADYDGYTIRDWALLVLEDFLEEYLHGLFYAQIEG